MDSIYYQKQCVGCGITFQCIKELATVTLYCTGQCQENHSLLKQNTNLEEKKEREKIKR